jgi:hypothetical protein
MPEIVTPKPRGAANIDARRIRFTWAFARDTNGDIVNKAKDERMI